MVERLIKGKPKICERNKLIFEKTYPESLEQYRWWRIQKAEWSCMDMNGGFLSSTNFIGKRIENKRHMSSQY